MIDVAAPAQRLLQAVVDHFDDHDWELPSRRYLAAGQQQGIAVDDEHLCVALVQLRRGAAENARGGVSPGKGAASATVASATYLLRLMRCVAVLDDDGVPPAAHQINADGLRLMADPGQLMDAVFAWAAAEPHNLTVDPGPVEPLGPEGGFAGHSIRITLAPVQDYPVGP